MFNYLKIIKHKNGCRLQVSGCRRKGFKGQGFEDSSGEQGGSLQVASLPVLLLKSKFVNHYS